MYLQQKKTTTDQASLWLDGVYLSLIHRDAKHSWLDMTFGEDLPLDLIYEQKAPCGNIKKAPDWKMPHGMIGSQDEPRGDEAKEGQHGKGSIGR